jgi:hypothetical protein
MKPGPLNPVGAAMPPTADVRACNREAATVAA